VTDKTEKQAGDSTHPRPRTLRQMALEVFSIVLGVLLALAVSEWQDNRNNEEKAGLALANIRAELQSNLDLLEIIYPNNARVVESISSDAADDQQDANIIPGVQMRSSAWQTLGTTGLANFIDYELLIELSQLYAMLDVYKETAYSFINANMSLTATATAMDTTVNNERFAENFLGFFQMLIQIEAAMIEAHEAAIESISNVQNSE
jgi:hypothetical protein